MGVISDTFGRISYENEADVSLKFTVPFLTSFLGFSKNGIVPEHDFPAKEVFFGLKKFSTKDFPKAQRPDFVVCLGSLDTPCFVIDSKGPDEDLEKHLNQLKSYSLGAKVNLLVITNGNAMKIYYGQDEILFLDSVQDVDIFFQHIRSLLHKDVYLKYRSTPSWGIKIIRSLDIDGLEQLRRTVADPRKERIRLELSDYYSYMSTLVKELENWHIAEITSLEKTQKVSPFELHKFRRLSMEEKRDTNRDLTLHKVMRDSSSRVKIIYGGPGIGKTTLFRYLAYTIAKTSIDLIDNSIPVLIRLRNYGMNKSIRHLALNSLTRRGYSLGKEEFDRDLLRKRFVFFLDGFDEIADQYKDDALQEIVDLVEFCSQQTFWTSSRDTSRLQIPSALTFEILPLERDGIELFVEENLEVEKLEFMNQIYLLGLMTEMQNTLLLAFAIHLHRFGNQIPPTRNMFIEQIIAEVEKWETTKIRKHETEISWNVKKQILEDIAYILKDEALGSTLPEEKLDPFLIKTLAEYEKSRVIPFGMKRETFLKELSATGLVFHDELGISFQNTAYLDYFASLKLAIMYIHDPTALNDKVEKSAWYNVIIATASKLAEPNTYIQEMLKYHAFKSAACLVESHGIEEGLIAQIVTELEKKCSSKFPTTRRLSLYYLSQIELKYTLDVFRRLLHSKHVFVKMKAIEQISKQSESEAREIVYKYLDWDEGGMMIGDTTQGTIARALSNLEDEQSHLIILDIWKRKKDIFTNYDCRNALLSLVYRKKLTVKLRDKILELFLSKRPENDISWSDKISGISDILIALGDEAIAPTLIRGLEAGQDNLMRNSDIAKILAAFKSSDTKRLLVTESLNNENPPEVRAKCAEALARSKHFQVELSLFEKLLAPNNNPLIRREAVFGLSKFHEHEVKDLLLRLVYDCDPNIHAEAVELLGEFGLLQIISTEEQFPKMFVPSVLLDQIRKYNLTEFLPIMEKLHNRWLTKRDDSERDLMNLAHTYLSLGKPEIAQKIADNFHENGRIHFRNKYAYADLADLCPLFDRKLGLDMLHKMYNSIEGDHFLIDRYIETLEKIGGEEAINELQRLCEEFVGKEDLIFERATRAIVSLSPKSKEEWLMNLMNSHPELKGAELHRAIEALGVIGSDKSISIIKKIAVNNTESEYILDICLSALTYIDLAKGISRFIDDEEILSS